MNRTLPASLVAICLALAPSGAAEAAVDPYAVIDEAFKILQKTNNYQDAQAVFSRGLRDAARDGSLGPDFAILYSMYADSARFADNPAFAVQLTDQGLSLVLRAETPDDELKNVLLVSRAYALADLGRYQEAVEAVRITATWMGVRYGQAARDDLESKAKLWAEQAAASDKQYTLPSIGKTALDLLDKATDALNKDDTQTARELASRALVPEQSGLSETDIRYLNARSYSLSGRAYQDEGRPATAILQFRRAIDLISKTPWDGKSKPVLDAEILSQESGQTLIWNIFANLAVSANATKDHALASAALDVAADFSTDSERRFTLIAQQAGMGFATMDFEAAEQAFARGVATARAAGDEPNARLAEFYVAIARLFRAEKSSHAPELEELVRKANQAVEAYGSDLRMKEYILSTAARMSYGFRAEYADAAPLAARTFDVFVARQRELAGNDEGQESARRERRSFLEIVIGAGYAAEENSSPAGAR